MKHSSLLVGAALAFLSSTAAADVGVAVYFPKSVEQSGPEAAAVWASAPAGDPLLNSTSVAAASGDLTAGTLRAFTDLLSQNPLPPNKTALLEANATFVDTVTFVGAPGQINVALLMLVDGSFAESLPLPAGAGAGTTVDMQVSISADAGAATFQTRATIARLVIDAGAPIITLQPPPNGTTIVATLNNDESLKGPPYNVTLMVGVPVQVGAQVGINAAIFISSNTGTPGITEAADFGSTAKVSLIYPAGYTFTSQSGAFLSRPDAGGLSLDGGTGGPPDIGGGTTSAASTSSGGASSGGASSGGASSSGRGSGSGGSGAVSSSGGSTGSGGGAKPSSGCSSVGGDDAWASGLLCVGAVLTRRAFRRRGRRA